MARSSRVGPIALLAALALGNWASPAAARPQRLNARLALTLDDGGEGRIEKRLVVSGPATDPSLARVIGARIGTKRFGDAAVRLIDRIEGDSSDLVDELQGLVSTRPRVTVTGGRATIVFAGSWPIGYEPDTALWHEGRRGPWITFVVPGDTGRARDNVVWMVAADLPNLEVQALRPGPQRDEVVKMKGEYRRELLWRFAPGRTRPGVSMQVRIGATLRRTLAARWEVFRSLRFFSTAVAPSLFFLPLLMWERRRRRPRKGDDARAIDRALRILCRLWLFLVAVEVVKWLASWSQEKLDYRSDVSYVITGVPLLATAAVALAAALIASWTRRLRALVLLLTIVAGAALAWSAHRLFTSFPSNPWALAEIASVAGVAATCGLALALIGLGVLLAEGLRAARVRSFASSRGVRLVLGGLAALLFVGPLVQVAAVSNRSFEARRLASSIFSDAVPGRVDWARELAYSFVYYPFNFSQIVLSVLPLVGLAFVFAAFACVGTYSRSSLFTSADGHYRSLVVLVFAAFVVGTGGALYGFAFPLAFVLALALSRVVLRPTLEQAQGRIEKLNGRRPRARPIVFRERQELLWRAAELVHVQRRQRTLYNELADRTISQPKYQRAYRASRREATRLTAGRSHSGVRLPQGVSPRELALALGPRASWWHNGTLAMRWGLLLATVPLAFYVYVLASRRLSSDFSSRSFFGVIDVFQSSAYQVVFWLAAAFTLGALYPYLVGMNGAIKGAALSALYGAATGLAVWILPGGGSNWFFRFLQLFLFLAVLGVVLDWQALVLTRTNWRQLVDHYQLRDVRVVAGYLAPAIGALIVIVDQLHSGQASEAISQLIKSIPGFVPPQGG
jgi:hypothetical protein